MFDGGFYVRNNNCVRYVSAVCGAGKTRAFIEHIKQKRFEKNFLYVAPTKRLISQVGKSLDEAGLRYRTIVSDADQEPVGIRIMEALEGAPTTPGVILLVCWAGYSELPYFPKRDDWIIGIDEVPQLDRAYDLTLPRNGHFIRDRLYIERAINENIGVVGAKNPSALKRELKQCLVDSAEEPFNQLYRDVISGYKDVYIKLDDWERLIEKNDYSETPTASNQLFFLSLYNEKLFKGTILMGANIEQSMLFDWMKRMHKLTFEKADFLEEHLRTVPKRSDTKIYYFLTGRNVSRAVLNHKDDAGSTVEDKMDLAIKELFSDVPYLYSPNKDRRSPILESHDKAKQISPSCLGLNDFKNYHACYFSAALNRTPQHFKMLEYLGFQIDNVHASTSREVAYQAVSRTSLRDPNSKVPVTVVVHDEATASMIGGLVGTSDIQQLEEVIPSKDKPYTDKEKKRRKRAKKIISTYFGTKSTPNTSFKNFGGQIVPKLGSGSINRNISYFAGNPLKVFVAFHKSVYDKETERFHMHELGTQEFISTLGTLAKAQRDKKEEALLCNPSWCHEKAITTGYRQGENFLHSSFLVLDFDNGEVSPEIFEKIFWSDAKRGNKRSFLIYNTFSRSKNQPSRFRVLMFYRERANKIEHHRACYDYVERQLEGAGFDPSKSGLDRSFKSPVQSFYLPSTNRSEPDSYLFEKRGTSTEKIGRYGLVPHEIWAISDQHLAAVRTSHRRDDTPSDDEISEITAKLRGMREGRHHEQFNVACKLTRIGCDESRIRLVLGDCLGSDPKMKKKISDTISSLRKYNLLK